MTQNSEHYLRSQVNEARISDAIREAGYDNQHLAG